MKSLVALLCSVGLSACAGPKDASACRQRSDCAPGELCLDGSCTAAHESSDPADPLNDLFSDSGRGSPALDGGGADVAISPDSPTMDDVSPPPDTFDAADEDTSDGDAAGSDGSDPRDAGDAPDSGPACRSHADVTCSGGNVHYVDSCGNLEEVGTICDSGHCEHDTCCVAHATRACVGAHPYWYDGCGNLEGMAEDCGGRGCTLDACNVGPAVTNLSATDGTLEGVTVTFLKGDAQRVEVFRARASRACDPGDSLGVGMSGTVEHYTYSDGDAVPGVRYYYSARTRTLDGLGGGTCSNVDVGWRSPTP